MTPAALHLPVPLLEGEGAHPMSSRCLGRAPVRCGVTLIQPRGQHVFSESGVLPGPFRASPLEGSTLGCLPKPLPDPASSPRGQAHPWWARASSPTSPFSPDTPPSSSPLPPLTSPHLFTTNSCRISEPESIRDRCLSLVLFF